VELDLGPLLFKYIHVVAPRFNLLTVLGQSALEQLVVRLEQLHFSTVATVGGVLVTGVFVAIVAACPTLGIDTCPEEALKAHKEEIFSNDGIVFSWSRLGMHFSTLQQGRCPIYRRLRIAMARFHMHAAGGGASITKSPRITNQSS
jgi:hypothetical protein